MLRAYWQQKNNLGVTERIEIDIAGFEGTAVPLLSNREGARFRHEPITSDESGGIINPYANRVQKGILDFFPKIQSEAERQVLTDILGEQNKNVLVTWLRDGEVYWKGYADTEHLQREQKPMFFGRIRATDLDVMAGMDYRPSDELPIGRDPIIQIIADVLQGLEFGHSIETRTSWTTEDTDDSTDFLSQIFADKYALRTFARTGNETDVAITRLKALRELAAPALMIRQIGGRWLVEQISGLSDPENVLVTVYDEDGLNPTSSTQDLRLDAKTQFHPDDLVVKTSSADDIYPAIKRVSATFNHRAQLSTIQIPNPLHLIVGESETIAVENFSTTGDERIGIVGSVRATMSEPDAEPHVDIQIRHGGRHWNDETGSWEVTPKLNRYELDPVSSPDTYIRPIFINTGDMFAQDSEPLEITFFNAADTETAQQASSTTYELLFSLENPAPEANSAALQYRLTQTGGYSLDLEYPVTIFGDGPSAYSRGALWYEDTGLLVHTQNWQRRGGAGYRGFHENALKESMDFQRSHTRKLEADLYGSYDPAKVLVYQGENFFYAGGQYSFVPARWSVTLFRILQQLATDDFQRLIADIDQSTGTTSTSGATTGGGISQSSADNRYLRQSLNGSDVDNASAFRGNIEVLSEAESDDRYAKLASENTFLEDQTINAKLIINGDIIQNGSAYETHAEQIYTSKDFIISREGAISALPDDEISGMKVMQADGTNDVLFGADNSAMMRVGWDGDDLQAIMTRDEADSMTDRGLGIWDAGNLRMITDAGLRYEDGVLITESIIITSSNGIHSDSDSSFVRISGGGSASSGASIVVGGPSEPSIPGGGRLRYEGLEAALSWGDNYVDISNELQVDGTRVIDSSHNAFFVDIGGRDLTLSRNAYIEGGLFAREFVVDQTRVMFNYQMSPGGGKIASITPVQQGVDIITFEDEEGNEFVPVAENDILHVQRRTGFNSGAIVKNIWRWVEEINGNDITIRTAGIDWHSSDDVGELEVGDDIVVQGNTTDENRNNLIDFDVSGQPAPAIRLKDAVTDVNEFDEIGTIGWLGGVDTPEFGTLPDEVGFYLRRGYIGGDVDIRGNLDVGILPRVSDEGLELHLRFDESVIDAADNYTTTLQGSASYESGVSGKGIEIGALDYIETGSAIELDGEFTLSTWFFMEEYDSNFGFIFGHSSDNSKIGKSNNTNSFFIRIVDEGSSTGPPLPPEGQLNHFLLTRDENDKIDIIINGGEPIRLYSDSAQSGLVRIDRIGRDDSDQGFSGILDETRIYGRKLARNEIKSLYLHPSGNSGGRISTNQLVAEEGFFDRVWAEDATIQSSLTMGDGVINLPPTFASDRNGQINRQGIDMVWEPDGQQRIQWYTGAATTGGLITSDSNGRLQLSSDFGVDVFSNSGSVTIGRDIVGDILNLNVEARVNRTLEFHDGVMKMNEVFLGGYDSYFEGLFKIGGANIPGMLSLGTQNCTISGSELILDRSLSNGRPYQSLIQITNNANLNLDNIRWITGEEPPSGTILFIAYPNGELTCRPYQGGSGELRWTSDFVINQHRIGMFIKAGSQWFIGNTG